MAQLALTYTRGWAANALNPHARQAAAVGRLDNKVALLLVAAGTGPSCMMHLDTDEPTA